MQRISVLKRKDPGGICQVRPPKVKFGCRTLHGFAASEVHVRPPNVVEVCMQVWPPEMVDQAAYKRPLVRKKGEFSLHSQAKVSSCSPWVVFMVFLQILQGFHEFSPCVEEL